MTDTLRVQITLPAPVLAELDRTASELGVNRAYLVARIVTEEVMAGDLHTTITASIACPVSNARLRELHWVEHRTIDQIAEYARDIDDLAQIPPLSTVRASLAAAEIPYRPEPREPIRRSRVNTPHRPTTDVPSGHRRCPKCCEIKPSSEYWADSSRPDGLSVYCKICKSPTNQRKSRSYYLANQERLKARARERKQKLRELRNAS